MAAVVRGERSRANPRAKTASSTRAAPRARGASARDAHAIRSAPAQRAGLGPKLALAVGALVIAGGAVTGLVLAYRDHAAALAQAAPADSTRLGRLLAPLGFRLQRVEVQGAPDMAKADILRAAQAGGHLAKGMPIVGLGLDDLRRTIEGTGWVKEAKVVRLLPDTLVIAVTPRQPIAVWQHLGRTKVVDAEGKIIGEADPARFSDLPLVVGDGAADDAHNILPLLRQRPRLMALTDALIRVDGRRWDLRLKDGSLIQLPAVGADSALIQLDQLDQKQRLLSLGFERVDLRDADAIAVRPRPPEPGAAATKDGAAAAAPAGPVTN
jgi:cell division protein FtsQ